MAELSIMRKLLDCHDKESIIHEVNKLSEEEAKIALIMALLSWRHGNKMNDAIKSNLDKRIADLEQQLAEQSDA